MEEKLRAVELRYMELEARLNASETYADPELVAKLNKEERELAPVVQVWREYCQCQADRDAALEMMNDPEMKELAQEEFAALCDYRLHNDGTAEEFYRKCLAFFQELGIM